jgi:uncharacterized membrane protein YvbJ
MSSYSHCQECGHRLRDAIFCQQCGRSSCSRECHDEHVARHKADPEPEQRAQVEARAQPRDKDKQ